ncbi:DUF5808 domain-containing protein [uncultured Anaerococcus sp.]|uniref:DUF5808 domain-containing protein n=1 Tax=uncultured Anaerococcus sp. TaxID=293428 RepID=UPI00288A2E1F|nr:DUF5808 domain-containing protein [uncultured Anaerococcus sp.]
MTEGNFISTLYASTILLIGILQIFVNSISKKGYVFGIRLDENSDGLRKINKKYKLVTLILTLALGAIQYLISFVTNNVGWISLYFFLSLGLIMIPLIWANKEIRKITKPSKQDKKKMVSIGYERKISYKAIGFIYGLSLALIIGTSLYLYLNYDKLPDRLIMHTDFNGNVTDIQDKTLANVFMPSLISLANLALFAMVNYFLIKARPRLSQEDPSRSLADNMKAKNLWSYYLGINALLMTILFEIGITSFSFGKGDNLVNILTGLTLITSIGGVIYLGFKVGTDGSRLNNLSYTSFEEDDDNWILGSTIYNNPDDPALFVNKRIGVGMTINIGRPMGKAILVISIIILIVSLVALFKYSA